MPWQRPLAAGKPRQTSDDVGNGKALVTLPVSLIGYLVACYWLIRKRRASPYLLAPVRWCLLVDDCDSRALLMGWRTLLERRRQRLPTVILGPLIVFETLAGCCTPFCYASKCRR